MRIEKWGEDLAVRLPASVVKTLGLKEGDAIVAEIQKDAESDNAAVPSRQALIERLRSLRGTISSDFKFDREEANER